MMLGKITIISGIPYLFRYRFLLNILVDFRVPNSAILEYDKSYLNGPISIFNFSVA